MKIDVARMILRRTCAATGERFEETEALRLADRSSLGDLQKMLAEAEGLAGAGAGPVAESLEGTTPEMAPSIWDAKPWLRPGARVVLPALEPGESAEAPEGLPAEHGAVVSIDDSDGTCIVLVDAAPGGAPAEVQVSVDDVEPEPEASLAGVHAAATLAARAAEVKKWERKLKLAQGRATRAAEAVARIERRLAETKEGR